MITIEEQVSGWYTLLRRVKNAEDLARAYQRLADTVAMLSRFQILSFTKPAIDCFEDLKRQRLGIKHMDLRIAAIARENSAVLVTRNLRDFRPIARLTSEDWSA